MLIGQDRFNPFARRDSNLGRSMKTGGAPSSKSLIPFDEEEKGDFKDF
jgi:hypothetical protein